MFANRVKGRPVCVREETAGLLRRLASPGVPGESMKSLYRRLSRRVGWSFSRVRECWHRRARRIGADELDHLRELAKAPARQNGGDVDLEGLAERVARLEAHLRSVDPDFFAPQIDALGYSRRSHG